jgi:hypothetical protein
MNRYIIKRPKDPTSARPEVGPRSYARTGHGPSCTLNGRAGGLLEATRREQRSCHQACRAAAKPQWKPTGRRNCRGFYLARAHRPLAHRPLFLRFLRLTSVGIPLGPKPALRNSTGVACQNADCTASRININLYRGLLKCSRLRLGEARSTSPSWPVLWGQNAKAIQMLALRYPAGGRSGRHAASQSTHADGGGTGRECQSHL